MGVEVLLGTPPSAPPEVIDRRVVLEARDSNGKPPCEAEQGRVLRWLGDRSLPFGEAREGFRELGGDVLSWAEDAAGISGSGDGDGYGYGYGYGYGSGS